MPAENTRNRHHSEKCSNEATYSVEVFRTQKMASHSTMITGHGHPNSHAAVSRRKGYLGTVNCTIDKLRCYSLTSDIEDKYSKEMRMRYSR